MYDISTKAVNRLKGELSTAFVDVAESNADAQLKENAEENYVKLIDSKIVEKMPSINSEQEKVTIIEAQSAKSHKLRSVVPHSHYSGTFSAIRTNTSPSTPTVSISSGYSVIKR